MNEERLVSIMMSVYDGDETVGAFFQVKDGKKDGQAIINLLLEKMDEKIKKRL